MRTRAKNVFRGIYDIEDVDSSIRRYSMTASGPKNWCYQVFVLFRLTVSRWFMAPEKGIAM